MTLSDLILALLNHLWQSTLFVAAAWLLSLALRNNQARTRHWVWLIASVKFLVPFSFLIALGGHLGWSTAPAVRQSAFSVVEQIGRPLVVPAAFVSTASAAVPATKDVLSLVLLAIWVTGCGIVAFSWWMRWRRVRAAVRAGSPLALELSVPVLSSPALLEPGIFGIVRPVLLLPDGITERLRHEQVKAILAHELCHVRRRDNLAAAVHMAVEAIFWFHPLVWWIGARLVEERERACDEEVLRLGNEPQVYAESILQTCRFYLESPLACMSGVTGSDLKKRIVRIMTHRVTHRLTLTTKLVLAAAAALAIAAPVTFGLVNAPQSEAAASTAESAGPKPSFEVASIKPNHSADRFIDMRMAPGGRFTANNITAKQLIENAYDIRDFQISGGPKWLDSAKYDIVAKAADSPQKDENTLSESERNLFANQNRQRLQSLLASRFNLQCHSTTKEGTVYALVLAKNGPKLQAAPPGQERSPNRGMRMRPGQLDGQSATISFLARALSGQLGRTVVDKTGLTGLYNFTLQWTPDQQQAQMFKGPGAGPEGPDGAPPPDASGPSIFTAVQEQLGLKLESAKGSVEILVIDHVEPPSEN